MTVPARTTLTDEIVANLRNVTISDGARTDVGLNVYCGKIETNEAIVPCAILIPGNEAPSATAGMNGHQTIAYSVSAYINRLNAAYSAHTDDPHAEHALVDAIIADVRDAVEGGVCALSALSIEYAGAEPHYHEKGGEIAGATVRFAITTPYQEYMPGN